MNIFQNPFFKTFASAIGGAATLGVDNALQHPTGGMLDAMQHNPMYAAAFTLGALFVHNVISRSQFAPKQ